MARDIMTTDRFVFFWGGWPSQWFKSAFVVDGVTYNCCEQFMMSEKARVFGDAEALAKILVTNNPREQKALGRKVRGFNEAAWSSVCRGIVYTGNLARFSQNGDLRDTLLATGDRTIVEASPKDRIWGIGLGQDDPRASDPSQWPGSNWLGIALMQVRETLRAEVERRAARLDAELLGQLAERARHPGAPVCG